MSSDKVMKEILLSIKTIASVGLSSSDEKESYWIVSYLKEQGYRIIPVNPTATEILGEKVYPDLSAIPESVDVVQVFRKSEDVPPVVEEAIKIASTSDAHISSGLAATFAPSCAARCSAADGLTS